MAPVSVRLVYYDITIAKQSSIEPCAYIMRFTLWMCNNQGMVYCCKTSMSNFMLNKARLSLLSPNWYIYCVLRQQTQWMQCQLTQSFTDSMLTYNVLVKNQYWLHCCMPYKVRCRYKVVNFLPNPHKIHPIARLLGQNMGCNLWFDTLIQILLWSTQCSIKYHVILDWVMTTVSCITRHT